ncbi:hypothetical protein ACIBH1_23235 [Nonomuraea sp. NPDC050663]|uniref:hypothetical protein n=1 Tax=Nonomuraea sp. NPDC050663 TaxID=3364370 RepID=UPI003790396A
MRVLTAALAALVLMIGASPAGAEKYGFTLYSDTGFANPIVSHELTECVDFINPVPGRVVGSYRNYPPPGCQVKLLTTGGTLELCQGAREVPAAYRTAYFWQIDFRPTPFCTQ